MVTFELTLAATIDDASSAEILTLQTQMAEYLGVGLDQVEVTIVSPGSTVVEIAITDLSDSEADEVVVEATALTSDPAFATSTLGVQVVAPEGGAPATPVKEVARTAAPTAAPTTVPTVNGGDDGGGDGGSGGMSVGVIAGVAVGGGVGGIVLIGIVVYFCRKSC